MSIDTQYRFNDFYIDVANRQLWRGELQLDLNARYFDALVLLVRDHGQLIKKDRFFSEVWGDVVVSDTALTQCIKDIRKQLGDQASNPQFIQTVPGYGYRFIGRVEAVQVEDKELKNGSRNINNQLTHSFSNESQSDVSASTVNVHISPDFTGRQLRQILVEGSAGTLGGVIAGTLGGLLYGFGLAYAQEGPGMGVASMFLVLMSVSALIGGAGGLGVSFGMATANAFTDGNRFWTMFGATFGGLIVGGAAKLLGVDAFNILFGSAPAGITGGLEGAVLGAGVAFGVVLSASYRADRLFPVVMASAATSAIAGLIVSVTGGRLMAGSLDLLSRSFTDSQLQLDLLGRFFGESEFGYLTQSALSGFEGLIFGACVAGAVIYARRLVEKNEL